MRINQASVREFEKYSFLIIQSLLSGPRLIQFWILTASNKRDKKEKKKEEEEEKEKEEKEEEDE